MLVLTYQFYMILVQVIAARSSAASPITTCTHPPWCARRDHCMLLGAAIACCSARWHAHDPPRPPNTRAGDHPQHAHRDHGSVASPSLAAVGARRPLGACRLSSSTSDDSGLEATREPPAADASASAPFRASTTPRSYAWSACARGGCMCSCLPSTSATTTASAPRSFASSSYSVSR